MILANAALQFAVVGEGAHMAVSAAGRSETDVIIERHRSHASRRLLQTVSAHVANLLADEHRSRTVLRQPTSRDTISVPFTVVGQSKSIATKRSALIVSDP